MSKEKYPFDNIYRTLMLIPYSPTNSTKHNTIVTDCTNLSNGHLYIHSKHCDQQH